MRTRAEWGGGPRPRRLTPCTHPYIEVHHDVYPFEWDGARHCREIEALHLGKGWNGAFYNVGIDKHGELWELRGVGYRSLGDHAPKYNDGSIVSDHAMTVVVFGDFTEDDPSQAQLDALGKLLWHSADKKLRYHAMRASTACCGYRLIPHLAKINQIRPTEDDDMTPDELLNAHVHEKNVRDTLHWAYKNAETAAKLATAALEKAEKAQSAKVELDYTKLAKALIAELS